MTIVAAAIGPDGTWLGCDRQTTLADRERAFTPPKWVIRRDRGVAVATSGSSLVGDLLRENAEGVLAADSPRQFWRAMVEVMAGAGCEAKPENDTGGFKAYDCGFLYVVSGMIFDIDSIGSILRIDEGWYARGSGDQYALGALFALSGTQATTEQKVIGAVHAAIRYDIRCGGPAWIERL